MTAENPGSINTFIESHPDINPEEAIALYSDALAQYRSSIQTMPDLPHSPDFIRLQRDSDEEAMRWLE